MLRYAADMWGRGVRASVRVRVHGVRSIFGRSASAVKRVTIDGTFPLELGGQLDHLEMAYEEWGVFGSRVRFVALCRSCRHGATGPRHAKKVILLLPSFSMSSHARSTVEDPTAGWYEGFMGPSRGVDTDQYRVVCPANLGAPFGSTSPVTTNPATGAPFGAAFPQVRVHLFSAPHVCGCVSMHVLLYIF